MNAFKQFSEDFRDYMEEKKLTTKRLSTTKNSQVNTQINMKKIVIALIVMFLITSCRSIRSTRGCFAQVDNYTTLNR